MRLNVLKRCAAGLLVGLTVLVTAFGYADAAYAGVTEAPYGKVTAVKKLTVRRAAGTDAAAQYSVRAHQVLFVCGEANGKINNGRGIWYRVRTGQGTGYVRADQVSEMKPATGGVPAGAQNGKSVAAAAEAGSEGKLLSSRAAAKNASVDVISAQRPSYVTKAGFPSTYLPYLAKLHLLHPNWKFTPVATNLDWKQAAAAQTAYTNRNLTWYSFPDSFKSVQQGDYNYLTNQYVGKDGSSFVAASPKAVKYYMDPRNWLTESGIFMFESNGYHSYQNLTMVRKVVKNNSILYRKANSNYFVSGGKKYDISSVYLASKSYNELGTGTKMISGKTSPYVGYYNAYNIGASDAAGGGAMNGLAYAKSAGWNSLQKAIVEGARFLRNGYINNRQDNAYLEHFNVLNGLSNVSTHEYMTCVYAGESMAQTIASNYRQYGILDSAIEFFIPVYRNMPLATSRKPSTSSAKDNNNYLKTLTLQAGTKKYTKISAGALNYHTSFKTTVPASADSVKISAAPASRTAAKVTGTGTFRIAPGTNTLYVKCKSSSGITRTYRITVVRKN